MGHVARYMSIRGTDELSLCMSGVKEERLSPGLRAPCAQQSQLATLDCASRAKTSPFSVRAIITHRGFKDWTVPFKE